MINDRTRALIEEMTQSAQKDLQDELLSEVSSDLKERLSTEIAASVKEALLARVTQGLNRARTQKITVSPSKKAPASVAEPKAALAAPKRARKKAKKKSAGAEKSATSPVASAPEAPKAVEAAQPLSQGPAPMPRRVPSREEIAELFLGFVEEWPGIKVVEAADELALPSQTLGPIARELVKERRVRTKGQGKGTGYYIVEKKEEKPEEEAVFLAPVRRKRQAEDEAVGEQTPYEPEAEASEEGAAEPAPAIAALAPQSDAASSVDASDEDDSDDDDAPHLSFVMEGDSGDGAEGASLPDSASEVEEASSPQKTASEEEHPSDEGSIEVSADKGEAPLAQLEEASKSEEVVGAPSVGGEEHKLASEEEEGEPALEMKDASVSQGGLFAAVASFGAPSPEEVLSEQGMALVEPNEEPTFEADEGALSVDDEGPVFSPDGVIADSETSDGKDSWSSTPQ